MNSTAYSVTIPATVNSNPRLSLRQKHLYGRIFALANREGYCFATNQFFADEFGLKSPDRISNDLTKLRREGCVKIEIFRNERKEVTKREIYPLLPLSPQKAIPIAPESVSSYKNIEKNIRETDNQPSVASDANHELSLNPIYPDNFPMFLEMPQEQMPQNPQEARVLLMKYSQVEAKGNSKNSLSPCTIDEILFLCQKHRLYYEEVIKKYRDIIELINDGIFQKKYGHKTIYRTLDKWLDMDITRGYLEPITDTAELNICFQRPRGDEPEVPKEVNPYTNYGVLTPERFKYEKMYKDLRERRQNGE